MKSNPALHAAIAAALGASILRAQELASDSWHDWFSVRMPDGVQLYFSFHDGKVNVSADFMRDSRDQYYGVSGSPKINVSVSRGADAIAKAVKSRLLPALAPIWHEHAARVAGSNNYAAGVDAAFAVIAAVGVTRRDKRSDGGYFYDDAIGIQGLRHVGPDAVRVEVEFSPAEFVAFVQSRREKLQKDLVQ